MRPLTGYLRAYVALQDAQQRRLEAKALQIKILEIETRNTEELDKAVQPSQNVVEDVLDSVEHAGEAIVGEVEKALEFITEFPLGNIDGNPTRPNHCVYISYSQL